jgi:predicted phage terminase large subunit-like protein
MQRLHEDDLVGHVSQQGGWHILRFPAIAEVNEFHVVRTPYGRKAFTRAQGEALHPGREPIEVLADIREIQGEYNFAGQYQQAPAPLGGGMIKVDWFKTYTEADLPSKFDMIFQSWDTANKPTELSDYSVCTSWGVKSKRLYVLHVTRKRVDYPGLKRDVRDQAEAFAAKTVLIEDKASGTQLIQELIGEGMHTVQRYEPTIDKVMRAHSVTSTIENGFVYVPEKAPWLAEYLHEMATFPRGRFDDQVDSTSQALDWFKINSQDQVLGFVEHLKQLAIHVEEKKVTTDVPEKHSCSNCGQDMTQPIPNGLRCMQCGAQWLDPRTQEGTRQFTRADILRGRGGFSRRAGKY